MALDINHAFTSAKADGPDATLVRPSNWNADHTVTGGYLPRSYLAGLGLANNGADATNDIDIAVGACRNDDNDNDIVLASALTKRLDATWVVGTGQGMRASGAAIANTTYHIFAIMRPDTGVVDVAADTSVTGANLAANTDAAYTSIRRIGSIVRSGGAIIAFSQVGDTFLLGTPVTNAINTNPGTAAITHTLANLPTGVKHDAIIIAHCTFRGNGANDPHYGLWSSFDQADIAPSQTHHNVAVNIFDPPVAGQTVRVMNQMVIRMNTSAQIRVRVDTSDANTIVRTAELGWIDRRGRDD